MIAEDSIQNEWKQKALLHFSEAVQSSEDSLAKSSSISSPSSDSEGESSSDSSLTSMLEDAIRQAKEDSLSLLRRISYLRSAISNAKDRRATRSLVRVAKSLLALLGKEEEQEMRLLESIRTGTGPFSSTKKKSIPTSSPSPESAHPSFKQIPRFYFRKRLPQQSLSSLSSKLGEAQRNSKQQRDRCNLLGQLAFLQHWRRDNVMDPEECDDLEEHLKEQSQDELMSYMALLEVDPRWKRLLCNTNGFKKCRRTMQGYASIPSFMSYARRCNASKALFVEICEYDPIGLGSITEENFEAYLHSKCPTFQSWQELQVGEQSSFLPFYVLTVARKFFFFLDQNRTGKIPIHRLVHCGLMRDLLALRSEPWARALTLHGITIPANVAGAELSLEDTSNWFLPRNVLIHVYRTFVSLDRAKTGMVNEQEMLRYGRGGLTQVFIRRVFQEYPTYCGDRSREMDFKCFLDFHLAHEFKHTRPGLRYFWRVLDIKHVGYIDVDVINFFFREVRQRLFEGKHDLVEVQDAVNEIFDMVKPRHRLRITLEDLVASGKGDTVVTNLTDYCGFLVYDNREQQLHDEAQEDIQEDSQGYECAELES